MDEKLLEPGDVGPSPSNRSNRSMQQQQADRETTSLAGKAARCLNQAVALISSGGTLVSSSRAPNVIKVRNKTTNQLLRFTCRVPAPAPDATTTSSLGANLSAGAHGLVTAGLSAQHTRENAQRRVAEEAEWPQDVMLAPEGTAEFSVPAKARPYIEVALVVSEYTKDDIHLATRAVPHDFNFEIHDRNLIFAVDETILRHRERLQKSPFYLSLPFFSFLVFVFCLIARYFPL